jgi:hypothetical protein
MLYRIQIGYRSSEPPQMSHFQIFELGCTKGRFLLWQLGLEDLVQTLLERIR